MLSYRGLDKLKTIGVALFCAVVVLLNSGQAHAFRVDLGEDATLDCDVWLAYGGAWRASEQKDALLKNINADDGNRNFDQWEMINNRFSAVFDTDLKYKKIGFFIRPRAYYDFAYSGNTSHDSPITHNNGALYGGGNNKFPEETQDRHEKTAEILDAFAYGTYNFDNIKVNGRLGRQVVSWGESLFYTGGISAAQSPVDSTMITTPGIELKELYLPVGQAFGDMVIGKNFTLGGYVQWEWDPTRLNEAGSFFSTADVLDEAGERLLVFSPVPGAPAATVNRGEDMDAKDSGQWGLKLGYLAENLNATEFGAYYINYHEKAPRVMVVPGRGGTPEIDWVGTYGPNAAIFALIDNSSYKLWYPEDVRLLGASFSTELFGTNLSGEVSYRHDYPVAIKSRTNPLGNDYEDTDLLQAQVSTFHNVSPRSWFFWENLNLIAEIGCNRVNGIDNSNLILSKWAWGYTVKSTFTWYGLMKNYSLDMDVPITFKGNPNGVSVVGKTFEDGQDQLSVGMDFTFESVYKFGLAYTAFVGSSSKDLLADRDYISAAFKYTF